MFRSTDTVSWTSRSRENNFDPLARWGVAVEGPDNGLYHGEHVPGPWLPDGHKKQWRLPVPRESERRKTELIRATRSDMVALDTLYAMCLVVCQAANRQGKQETNRGLSFHICHAATL